MEVKAGLAVKVIYGLAMAIMAHQFLLEVQEELRVPQGVFSTPILMDYSLILMVMLVVRVELAKKEINIVVTILGLKEVVVAVEVLEP